MFAKALGTNWYAKTVYNSLLRSHLTETDETDHLTIAFVYLYWSRGTGKFPLAIVRRFT